MDFLIDEKSLKKKINIEIVQDKLIYGDAVSTMKRLPTASLDLVVTSPPYNLKNSSGNGMKDGRGGKWSNAALLNGYEAHNDNMPHVEYVKWQRACLKQMFRLINENGAIFYNHKWRVQNGLLQDRSDIVKGFPVRQIIIWKRKGGINFNAGYFLPTYEVIYVIAKPGFKLAQKANSRGDIWEIMQDMNNPHPAPFPKELIDIIISSTDAKLILDPFMGSGTTALSAMGLNRSFIGIEISKEYSELAQKRLNGEVWNAKRNNQSNG
jgi:site-specific DNA-methyltransferase (adenine-specific)